MVVSLVADGVGTKSLRTHSLQHGFPNGGCPPRVAWSIFLGAWTYFPKKSYKKNIFKLGMNIKSLGNVFKPFQFRFRNVKIAQIQYQFSHLWVFVSNWQLNCFATVRRLPKNTYKNIKKLTILVKHSLSLVWSRLLVLSC